MAKTISPKALEFLKTQEVAVLSTITPDGEVQGTTIYYTLYKDSFYVITKSDSSKAHNMMQHAQVALTIFDPNTIKTAQIKGVACIEGGLEIKRHIFDELVKPRDYDGEKLMPPVTQLSAGGFIAFRIEIESIQYTDYKQRDTILPTHTSL